jgi:DNA-binding IclR family transcriptional regulator
MSSDETLSSVHNALRILRAFGRGEHALGVSELARRLGIAKSTVHRLLGTLVAERFVRKLDNNQYALGIALWELGTQMVSGLELRDVAHPILEELRNATGETVHLSILEGAEVVYIDRLESPTGLTLFRRIGYRLPAYATSTGKAILAFSPTEVIERVFEAGMKKLAPGTLTSKKQLLARLEDIREAGYVVSIEESERGAASIGAPVFDYRDVVGAISVAGPAMRFPPDAIARFSSLVVAAARRISRGMGASLRKVGP